MQEEIKWEFIEEAIAIRLGGNPSYRLVRRLTGYAYNLLDAMHWPTVDGESYELVINGIANSAIIGSEELR